MQLLLVSLPGMLIWKDLTPEFSAGTAAPIKESFLSTCARDC